MFSGCQKGSDARRASNRSFDFCSGQALDQFPKSNVGGGTMHYSITPLFQSLVRWSEAIERNEADGVFSAA